MAIVFLDSEGTLLVEFLNRGATINSELFVQTLKDLLQRFRIFRPNRKDESSFILPIIPIEDPTTSTFLATWRLHSENAVLRKTRRLNSVRE
jgi:hypothetical protein